MVGINWNPVFLVISIASAVVAIYFGVKSIRRKQPVVAWFRHKLIGIGADAPAELRLLFNNIAVPEVYRTKFVVFNRGKLAIKKEDFRSNFRIVFEDGEILRQPIIYEKSSESIGFRTSAVQEGGKHQIDLNFDYLNEKDGAVFEVLHTKDADTHTEARLIDVNEIIEMRNLKPMRIRRLRYYFISFLVFLDYLLGDYMKCLRIQRKQQ